MPSDMAPNPKQLDLSKTANILSQSNPKKLIDMYCICVASRLDVEINS